MTSKNPFPGMNPFFEQQCRDAHTRLLTYLQDALQERSPPTCSREQLRNDGNDSVAEQAVHKL